MAKSKLFLALERIPNKLIDRFTSYLESPLHNKHQETIALWKKISIYAPDFDVDDFELFKSAFPGKKYDNARLRVLKTYLSNHLEKFLVLQEVENNLILQNRLLRNATDRFQIDSIGRKAWEPISGNYHSNIMWALESFHLAQSQLMSQVRKSNRGHQHDLVAVIEPLDAFYFATRFKYLCAMADPLTNPKPLQFDAQIKHLFHLFEAQEGNKQPLAAVYYHLLKLFLEADVQRHVAELKSLLENHAKEFDSYESLNLYTFWFNFLNFRRQSGVPEALFEIFQLYKQMIRLEVLFGEGSFAANHFRNIVTVAALLNEFEWGFNFLNENHEKVRMPWRKGIYAYCMGYLLFAQGKYSEAKGHLIDVEFHDFEYKISHQLLFIRIYYETDDMDGIEDIRNALKIFLYRGENIPKSTKDAANNFARFASKLFALKGLSSPKAKAEKILNEIRQGKLIRDRRWLIEKANELI